MVLAVIHRGLRWLALRPWLMLLVVAAVGLAGHLQLLAERAERCEKGREDIHTAFTEVAAELDPDPATRDRVELVVERVLPIDEC